jgi:hypothetical protein
MSASVSSVLAQTQRVESVERLERSVAGVWMLDVGLVGEGGEGNLVISIAEEDLNGLVAERRALMVALGSLRSIYNRC